MCPCKIDLVSFQKKIIYSVINYLYILLTDDSGPPPSTVINQNETFAKVVFKPTVVQQAKIAQNGILGDFIIRYDVNREQSIGDIQVMGSLLLFHVSCLILLVTPRTRDFNTYLRERELPILRKSVLTPNMFPRRPAVFPCWRLGLSVSCFNNLEANETYNLIFPVVF